MEFNNKITELELESILESGVGGYSVGNVQSWSTIVVKDPETKVNLALAGYMREDIQRAEYVIVVCSDQNKSKKVFGVEGELYSIIDASIAVNCMVEDADFLGIRSCVINAFDGYKVCKSLNVPKGVKPLAMILLGVGTFHDCTKDHDLKEFIHYEKY
jgi:nitroreductase